MIWVQCKQLLMNVKINTLIIITIVNTPIIIKNYYAAAV